MNQPINQRAPHADSTKVPRRSQAIPIKRPSIGVLNMATDNETNITHDSPLSAKDHYDQATWRMYFRIIQYRQKYVSTEKNNSSDDASFHACCDQFDDYEVPLSKVISSEPREVTHLEDDIGEIFAFEY